MRHADSILRINHHPTDAPNCTFIANDIGIGLERDDPDAGRYGFFVELEESLDGRWLASVGVEGAGPPYGEGPTELGAVRDLRDKLLEVLRGDIGAYLDSWADDLDAAADDAEDDDSTLLELSNVKWVIDQGEPDDGEGLSRSDRFHGLACNARWIAQLLRAQAELRRLDAEAQRGENPTPPADAGEVVRGGFELGVRAMAASILAHDGWPGPAERAAVDRSVADLLGGVGKTTEQEKLRALGLLFRRARAAAGFGVKQIASALGVPTTMITTIERGGASAEAHPSLHSTGACSCGGEGRCDWCREIVERFGPELVGSEETTPAEPPTEVARLDRSKLPPGYEESHDPPGMQVFTDDGFGSCWHYSLTNENASNNAPYESPEGARNAAWRHFWRRLALSLRLTHEDMDDLWPHCLEWSDEQVAEVERWLLDSTAERPQVLDPGHIVGVARG